MLKALTYFADAESEPLYPLGLTDEKWQQIKKAIIADVRIVLRSRLGRGHVTVPCSHHRHRRAAS